MGKNAGRGVPRSLSMTNPLPLKFRKLLILCKVRVNLLMKLFSAFQFFSDKPSNTTQPIKSIVNFNLEYFNTIFLNNGRYAYKRCPKTNGVPCLL